MYNSDYIFLPAPFSLNKKNNTNNQLDYFTEDEMMSRKECWVLDMSRIKNLENFCHSSRH